MIRGRFRVQKISSKEKNQIYPLPPLVFPLFFYNCDPPPLSSHK